MNAVILHALVGKRLEGEPEVPQRNVVFESKNRERVVDAVISFSVIGLGGEYGYDSALVEDITNLVTCCRACDNFGNHFTVAGPPPGSEAAFYEVRDAVFREREAVIAAKREAERDIYSKLRVIGSNGTGQLGEDA